MLQKILFPLVLTFVLCACQPAPRPGDGFAIYLLVEDVPTLGLAQADLDQLVLAPEPLISSADIVSYDKDSHVIELTETAYKRVRAIFPMPVKVDGIPFVVTVGDERIYAGAFWTPLSSLSYDGIVIGQPLDPEGTLVQIVLGYPAPEAFIGTDPRSDARILEALEKDGKLK